MSIAATRLDEYRLAYDRSNLDAWEHKLSNYGVLAAYQKDTPNTIPGYADLIANRASEVRTVSIPVIDRTVFTTAARRTCDALTHELTSAYVTPTWTTLKTGFNMIPEEHEGNLLKYQDIFNKKMFHMQRTLAAALDTLAYTNINANIAQVVAADGNPFTLTTNALVVAAADNELLFNELGAIMEQDDFPSDGINVVGSPRLSALVRENLAQGPANAENRGFQFGGYDFFYSNRVTVAVASRDTMFAAPPGSLAFLTWVDGDSRANRSSTDGKEWSVANLPILGFDVGLMYQSTCSNQGVGGTARATGLEATLSESFMFSVDYSFNCAYNVDNTTYSSPIHKFNLTTA